MPVEIMEAEHPVRVEEYAFVPDSCGAGRWRGGLGLRHAYRILAAAALLQMRSDRTAFRPYGLAGGGCGGGTRNFIEQDGRRRPLPGKVTMRVAGGTVIVHEQAGGGFGLPELRDAARVADGKITRNYARAQHGVSVGDDGSIDARETARLRAALARATRRS